MVNFNMKNQKAIAKTEQPIQGEIVGEKSEITIPIEETFSEEMMANAIEFKPKGEAPLSYTIPMMIKLATKENRLVKFRHYNEIIFVSSKSNPKAIKAKCEKIHRAQKW